MKGSNMNETKSNDINVDIQIIIDLKPLKKEIIEIFMNSIVDNAFNIQRIKSVI